MQRGTFGLLTITDYHYSAKKPVFGMLLNVLMSQKDFFQLILPEETDFGVAVYNSIGQQIHSSVNSNRIDMTNQIDGIYFIKVKTKTEVFNRKIIKKE